MPLPAPSTSSQENKVKEFQRTFYTEYISESKWRPQMGTGEGSMIQTRMRTSGPLERIQFTLINKATGTGKRGTATLKGNEQQVKDRTFEIQIDMVREGFASHKLTDKLTAYDMMKANRVVAKDWISEITKFEISEALRSVNGKVYDNQVLANNADNDFVAATDGEKDIWHEANSDRILYGTLPSNRVANDHSASLAAVPVAQKIDHTALDLMKRMAMKKIGASGPKIRPIRIKGDETWYLVYLDSYLMRDLYADPVIQAFHSQALPRVRDSNPFFTGGELIWKGMIIKENEDFPLLEGAGNTGADLGVATLCGAQALGIAWGQLTQFPTEVDDYGTLKGIAAEEIRGIKKMTFGTGANNLDDQKDHGVVTGFFGTVGD